MSSPRKRDLAAIAAAVIGLAASVATAIDDLGPTAKFCAETGCETVRSSAWARPLGIPMSLLGIGFFVAALVLAFVHAPRLRRMLAIAGGAWAVWLIALQAFVIGAWCKLCLVADPAAIAYAACVLAGASSVRFAWRRVAMIAPAVVAVTAALGLWTSTARPPQVAMPPGTPECVVREQVAGKVTVVEFVDFECPFCREMQKRLDTALASSPTRVRVVRKMVPLPRHVNAYAAALAWCCADAQGRGDDMARALFEADPATLDHAGCEKIAARLGLDLERYRDAMGAAKARVQRDVTDAKAAGVPGLPTIYIGGERMVGADATVDDLVAAINRAST